MEPTCNECGAELGDNCWSRLCSCWNRDNPKKYLINNARNLARKKKLVFSITECDFEIPERCPVFDVPLVPGTRDNKDWSPSLDRVDNTRGYEPGNVCVISHKANRLKSELSLLDLERLASYIKKEVVCGSRRNHNASTPL